MDRRSFVRLSAASALGVLALPASAEADSLTGEATRLGPGSVRLTWSGAKKPVRVLASSDPDAPAGLMRVLTERAAGGRYDAPFAPSPRPYFLLENGASSARVAERLLPLEGGRNFRDLGGYPGADGRQVRWGRLYRSGVTAGLTANDLTYLSHLGVRTVCDFRSTGERTREPSAFQSATGVELVSRDYELDYSGMAALFAAQTREEAIAAFAKGYADFAVTLAPQFADLFQRLIRQETPLAFNCSAGKDRTGLAAALVLSALGCPREVVIADYAASEKYVPVETYLAALKQEGEDTSSSMGEAERKLFSRLPEPVIRVLLGTPAEVMVQTLARLDAEEGGPIGYVTKRLGVSAAEIDILRSFYLNERA